jgi:ribonuclease HI
LPLLIKKKKLKVPLVVQVFLWWGCNNLLPSKEKLFHRKVVFDPFCPLCGIEVETAGHFLWQCRCLIGVWAECTSIQKGIISEGDFLSLFQHFSNRLE